MDDRVGVVNRTRGTILAGRARRARGFLQRLLGLMGAPALPAGEALVLDPCASIHMFFMRFPIDVVFAAADLSVVAVVHAIRPWRMTRFYPRARLAIELPAGTAAASGTCLGDQLAFDPVE